MKKLIAIFLLLSSCIKTGEKVSDEVLVTVLNERTTTITFYNNDTGQQVPKDIFDCEYVSVLRVKIPPGTYTVKAETSTGKTVTKTFTKSVYAGALGIEF
jgi:hypothetical protein